MAGKIGVLLIAHDFFSGIGSAARHIADAATDIDYSFFCCGDIKKRKNEFLKLAASADVVHWFANLSWMKFPVDFNLNDIRAPQVATVHHVDEDLKGRGEKEELSKILCASQCDAIHVVSSEWKDYVESRTKTPVFLAHHAIDLRRFIANRKAKRARGPFRIGAFGFSATVRDRKRLDILLAALDALRGKGYQFELVVQGSFGKVLKGPLLGRGISVRNLGFLSRDAAFRSYRCLDLYVCSSDIEGGPLPVLEALASGVPVVSTRVGIALEALSAGGGILVEKGDPQGLALTIARFMDDPALSRKLSREAIAVSEDFSWGNVGKEYVAMYKAVIRSGAPRHGSNAALKFPEFQRQIQLIRDSRRWRSFRKALARTA